MKNAFNMLLSKNKQSQTKSYDASVQTNTHNNQAKAPTPTGYDKKELAQEFKNIWGRR